jgi:hypothetical protein
MILRWKHRNGALPEGLVPLDTDPLVFNPLVSVIIPAFNESSSISSTLQRVASAASDPVSIAGQNSVAKSLASITVDLQLPRALIKINLMF